ncbi:Phosphoglucomutase, first 3 domain-containing protein [Serendipita vermifera]|nr:Phosphoglucomutase, first 3 domain-containing protein [Serendipita vermifera]
MVYSTKELVDSWLKWDGNETTRAEIQRLWDEGRTEELERRLRKRIEFGTAGLRGRMEAGFSRMNDLIIIQASQGLCNYILNNVEKSRERGVVVGHDHRYNSERWAQLTAAVFLQAGFKVYLHRNLVHTPLVPFTVQQTRAAGGVMITASHNPKNDNGYKVYWENAVQIISPHDSGIADSIMSNLEPKFSSSWTDVAQSASQNLNAIDCTQEMYEKYFSTLKNLVAPMQVPTNNTLKFVTTPMHGVGNKPVLRALQDIGLTSDCISVVKEQQNPDPEFPTVSFPNPEEHGALSLAMKTADESGATYILAQDPDADRFAAAERRPDGSWHQFSGDQLGSLFAARALEKYKQSQKPMSQLAMVASTVSSKMIESMGKVEGFKFVECLTGFKYIGNVALQLVEQNFIVPFGYEEAIGFMVETGIRDKDGVSATLGFVELVTQLHARGSSALRYIDELYEKYGYFETNNSYFICNDPAVIDSIFHRLRNYPSTSPGQHQDTWKGANGATYPSSIGSLKINSIRDLTSGFGYDSTTPTLQPELPLSGGHMVTFRAGSTQNGGAAITLTIRTSGTEPKIKYYLEGQGENRDLIKSVLRKVVEELGTEWMQASQNNLQEP